MKRVQWLIFLALATGWGAWAQQVTGVTVGLSLSGPIFTVDGQQYTTQQTFLWPAGSTHILQFPVSLDPNNESLNYQADISNDTHWTFSGWQDNLGLLSPAGAAVQTVTADPSITSIIGQVTANYRVTLQFLSTSQGNTNGGCSGAPDSPPAGETINGIVYVNGACYSNNSIQYLQAGPLTLNAFPYPGYAFAGWYINNFSTPSYLSSYNLTGPTVISPSFQPAKRVDFRTSPLGFQVIVDHAVITTPAAAPAPPGSTDPGCMPNYAQLPPNAPAGLTPLCMGDFDFVPGSAHQIAAPSPQEDNAGNFWVFSGFSDGLAQNSTYVANNQVNTQDVVYANFVPGVKSGFSTNPPGLSLQIDGRSNWPSDNFIWGQGETHQVNAPLTVTDSKGRAYQFVSWSNGGPASQTITVPTGVMAFSMVAAYQELGQVQITTNPPGLTITAGGAPCTTPCVLNQASGAQIQISMPSSVPVSANTRYDMDAWSGSGPASAQPVTFTQNVQTFTANYHASYLLAAVASPAAGASFKFSPASPDGFFANGTAVTVSAVAKGGYKFDHWSGDLTGSFTTGYLTMSSPHSVMAMMDSVPYIPPAGIINSAGPTPDGSVAAGSLISIFGQNLAGAFQVGPGNPLAQTLGNVTVSVNGQFFPLLFVSPQQINAQVPWELAPGTYTLTVQYGSQAPVNGQITVSRNAPGVYQQQNAQNLPLALAVHQDGTLITPDSPARRNEIITIYCNGLGPSDEALTDGFPTPDSRLWPTADPITIGIGSTTLAPYWSGAAPDMVGTDVVQLQINAQVPSATTVSLVINANGNASSVVQLPVQ